MTTMKNFDAAFANAHPFIRALAIVTLREISVPCRGYRSSSASWDPTARQAEALLVDAGFAARSTRGLVITDAGLAELEKRGER